MQPGVTERWDGRALGAALRHQNLGAEFITSGQQIRCRPAVAALLANA